MHKHETEWTEVPSGFIVHT